jgi:hypothetical protein
VICGRFAVLVFLTDLAGRDPAVYSITGLHKSRPVACAGLLLAIEKTKIPKFP